MIKTYVNIDDKRWDKIQLDFAHIVNITADIVGFKGRGAETSVVLSNDAEIRKLNKQYRKIDKPTNVLSFETGDPEMLGDIIISYDTVTCEAKNENKSFENHATHMVVHGILHLFGYNHLNNVDATKMENIEIKILKKLGIKNPYGDNMKENKKIVKSNVGSAKKKNWALKLITPIFMIFAGAIASFGFAPYYIGIATVIGFITLYIFSNNHSGFWRGYGTGFWFGAAYGTLMFYWMLNSIFVDPVIAAQMKAWFIPGLVGIAIGSGAVFGLSVAMTAAVKIYDWRRPIIFATFWTFVLFLREWLLTGFPWNPIANITIPYEMISNSMSLWGALGLSFIIIGLIFSLAYFLIRMKDSFKIKHNYLYPFYIFIPLLIIGAVVGSTNIKKSENRDHQSPIFRIVQPSKNQSIKLDTQLATDNINNLINLSMIKTETKLPPDIIVWPETAYPFVITSNEFPPAKIIKKPIVTGAMSYQNGEIYNSMIVSDKDGNIVNVYNKSHLVPFGEYRPLGDIIPTPGQLFKGAGPELISITETCNFVPAICYEVIFSDSLLPKNAMPDFILNITNDTWFGESSGPYQHLDMVRRYAIESGLPIIRANYSGISAFISADGRILSQLGLNKTGIIDGSVSGAHITPYRMIGLNWMMVIILLFSICILIPKYVRRKKD